MTALGPEYISVRTLEDFRRMLDWTDNPAIIGFLGLKVDKVLESDLASLLNISALDSKDISLSLVMKEEDKGITTYDLRVSEGFEEMNTDQKILALAIVMRNSLPIPNVHYSYEISELSDKKINIWLKFLYEPDPSFITQLRVYYRRYKFSETLKQVKS